LGIQYESDGKWLPGRRVMRAESWFAAVTAFGVAATLTAAAAAGAQEDPYVERLREGQRRFETVCSGCHGVDRPLARDMDRVQWEGLLLQMADKGAVMDTEDRTLILDYLAARYVFAARCTVCHTKERVSDRARTFQEWKDAVAAMAGKKSGLLSGEEARAITAYLTVVLGPGPSGR